MVLCDEAYASIIKSLSLLGFGSKNIITLPSDEQGRISIDKLPMLDNKTILILQAGNVNSGCFDDIDTLCDIANQSNSWVHIDGAFGLWANASSKYCHLSKGIEKADSWSVDAHKTLNTPYDCGIVLCKHKSALIKSM